MPVFDHNRRKSGKHSRCDGDAFQDAASFAVAYEYTNAVACADCHT